VLPAQQPALSWLADPPTRRRSAVLALLALPPVPERDDAPAAQPEPHPVPLDRLPRRAPARPAPVVPGPRAPVLDRVWARDQDTLQRLIVGLRAL
jgi:hypothetical protein